MVVENDMNDLQEAGVDFLRSDESLIREDREVELIWGNEKVRKIAIGTSSAGLRGSGRVGAVFIDLDWDRAGKVFGKSSSRAMRKGDFATSVSYW